MSPAIEIKAADVQKLRQMTGTGLMDCKKALTDAKGDMDKAVKLLRERGVAKSSKRADRQAGEGVVVDWVQDNQKEGILFELNSETDFVARNDEFVALAKSLLGEIRKHPEWTGVDHIPADAVQALSGKVGEKIQARRFARFKTQKGLVFSYVHPGSKLGVLLTLDGDKEVKGTPAAQELAKELALQIAGASPSYVSRKDVPADVLEREKEITKKQMEGQKKPPEILEKIATGKLQQFYSVHCLMDQPHVRDSSGKTNVQDVMAEASKKEGNNFKVPQFVRFRVGSD